MTYIKKDYWRRENIQLILIGENMTIQEQEIALAEHLGYEFRDEGWRYPNEPDWQKYKAVYQGDGFIGLSKPDWTQIPDWASNLNLIAAARKKLINTPKLRYTYCNKLREVLGRRPDIAKNKFDVPLVSDYDIVNAEPQEHLEALVKMLGVWKN